MVIEQAIMTALLAASTISNLVVKRIYFATAPQDVVNPYIVFFKVSSVRVASHDGASGLAAARFQFSCFAETYKEAKSIALALQGVLEGYSGTLGAAGGVQTSVFYENEQDLYEQDSKLFHIAVDYRFLHQE